MVSVERRLRELNDRFWNHYPKDDRSASRNRHEAKAHIHVHKGKKKNKKQ